MDLLADAVVAVHFGFLAFLVGGGFLALRRPRLIGLHVLAVVWSAGILTLGQPCPLTALEGWARGEAVPGGFIDRYVTGVLFPAGLEPVVQGGVAVAVLTSWAVLVRQRRQAVTASTSSSAAV